MESKFEIAMADLVERITEYLSLGGLFNPEMMNHDAVSALLIDCRAELSRLSALVAWQDIETAPKGNGTILIGWGEYRERDGFSPAFMRWYDSVNGWSVNAMPFYPTHWQPLPAPPVSQLKDTTNADK